MSAIKVIYSIKIWLSSVLISPILYITICFIKYLSHEPKLHNDYNNELLSTYFLIVICQFIFSLLIWILFLLFIITITTYCEDSRFQKPLISIIGILLTICAFKLVFFQNGFNIHEDFLYLMICNCVCIAGGSWYFKLAKR
jgi:hypothetical protein